MPLRARFARALATPFAVGLTLFLAALVGAIAFTIVNSEAGRVAEAVRIDSQKADGAHADEPGASELGASEFGGVGQGSSVLASEASDSRDDEAHVSEFLIVHVAGEVHSPGVVELQVGSRIVDAIEAAGGATAEAVLDRVNLARVVSDGEQILVPNAETATPDVAGLPSGSPDSGIGPTVVNINTADAVTLQLLPGIGPALAERIIAWRQTHGPFTRVEELLQISGIGASKFADIADSVQV